MMALHSILLMALLDGAFARKPLPLPPAIHCESSNGSRIAIVEGEDIKRSFSSEFLYGPATDTLRIGLNSKAAVCGYEVLPLQKIKAGVNAENATMQKWLRRPENARAPAGDIVIFVGETNIDDFATVCLSGARARGAR